jgi:hypothetical protein
MTRNECVIVLTGLGYATPVVQVSVTGIVVKGLEMRTQVRKDLPERLDGHRVHRNARQERFEEGSADVHGKKM